MKKIKVKMFESDNSCSLEEQINVFSEKNEVEIKDIKMKVSLSTFEFLAMVIYTYDE